MKNKIVHHYLLVVFLLFTLQVDLFGQAPAITSFTPANIGSGTIVTINGTNLGNPATVNIGGVTALLISANSLQIVAIAMPGVGTTTTMWVTTAAGTSTTVSFVYNSSMNYPNSQQAAKMVGTGGSTDAAQGTSVAISADGNTAIVGGKGDNSGQGAVWIYTRNGNVWTQQGSKLVGTGGSTDAAQGSSVAISADGNTVVIGGYHDNSGVGAAWIFTRSNNVWTQQGNKLVANDYSGTAYMGCSVSINATGSTVVIGGYGDNSNQGATWIFSNSVGSWTQAVAKLVGTGGSSDAKQGYSVAISADGLTVLAGAPNDNSAQGATWVFYLQSGVWSQVGNKLVGTGNTGAAAQGTAVAVNALGTVAIAGGPGDNSGQGAAWGFVFKSSTGLWTQEYKMVATGNIGAEALGSSLCVNAIGNIAIVGAPNDNSGVGAFWVFQRAATRGGIQWLQLGSKQIGSGNTGNSATGSAVAITSDGYTAIAGGPNDNNKQGAIWAFTSAYTWTGLYNTLWANATQWNPINIPTASDNAIIASAPYNPIITTTQPVNNLTINAGASVTVNGSGILQIGAGIYNSGTFDATAGTIQLNGLLAQTITASTFLNNSIKNLIISNAAGVTLGGPLTVTGILTLNSGTLNTGAYLTIAPGAVIVYAGGSISGNVTLQQNVIAQRGFRMFANPFSTAQTLSTVAANNNITINTSGLATGLTDARTFDNSTNSWTNLTSSVSANQPYALFIRGLANEVTGNNYSGGPTAFKYSVSGTLNNSVSITPANVSNFMLVGNPFAAPVKTLALTGAVAKPYYTYQITKGGTSTAQRTKAGVWVAAGSNSNSANTIPVLGVLAYQPASLSTYNITTADINNAGTPASNLFGTENMPVQIELLLEKNGDYQDKLFVRLDASSNANATDNNDLSKLYNDNINIYTKSADNSNLAIDARAVLTNIPLGIKSIITGSFTFKLSSNNLPQNTVLFLKDKLLNVSTELKTDSTYAFDITADTLTQGEHRFELVFSNLNNSINTITPPTGLNATVMGNVIKGNTIVVQITGSEGPVSVHVTDITGRMIAASNTVNGTQQIAVGNAVSGMLLLYISDGKTSILQKLMKL